MKSMIRLQRIKQNEQGMVAILVTMVLMTVISLITLGFVQTVIREQKQITDRQLSSQANYAAESGVNLVRTKLAAGSTVDKTSCGPDSTYPASEFEISPASDRDIHITCLLVDTKPQWIEMQNVSSGSRIMRLQDSNGQPFTSIYVAWQDRDGSTAMGCPDTDVGKFPDSTANWNCGQPLLRVELVPLCGTANCFSQQWLTDRQFVSFLYPQINGVKTSSLLYSDASAGNLGKVKGVVCNSDITYHRYCVARVDVSSMNSSDFAIKLNSLYKTSDVTLSAATSGGPSRFTNGQVTIDSTARAIDISKRIRVTIPLIPENGPDPGTALSSSGQSLCKLYYVTDTSVLSTAGDINDASNPCGRL